MKKKGSKENKTWGVSGLYRHYFFKNDKTGDSLLKLVRDHWEVLRRCQEYLKLCEGVEFHESGIVSTSWMMRNREKHDEINKRLNQVGIKQLLDPKKDFLGLPPEIVMDIIGPNPVEVIALKNPPLSFKDKKSHDQHFLEDGKYLTVKIDVSQKKEDIVHQIKLYFDYYRDLIDIPDKRYHDKQQYWQVYDLLKADNPPTEIIKTLWPDEYHKGIDSDESKLAEKYKKLIEKYKKQSLKDFDERAYKETYGECQLGNLKLYARVRDNKIKAEKKLEELGLRFKETP